MISLITIIVPVYNVAKYLRRGIDSLLAQTYTNIEIILVNDGSTDCSLDICKEYEMADRRVILIDKANGGVSSARNAGLKIAKGKYIGFLDPDDWIEPDMYENMYTKIMHTNSDICFSNYITEKKGMSIPRKLLIEQETLTANEIASQIIANMISGKDLNSNSQPILGSVCRLLIKRDIIENNAIIFNRNIVYMEDLLFCIQLLLRSNKVCIDNGYYYHYMQNADSATKIYRENLHQLSLEVYESILAELVNASKYSQLEKRMNIRYVEIFLFCVRNEVNPTNKKALLIKLRYIKSLCNDFKLQEILEDINPNGYTFRKKMILRSIRRKSAFLLYAYYFAISRIFSRTTI